jgi:ribosomal protein L11 methyltransferase
MSGFYVSDIDILKEKAESLGLSYIYYKEKNNWAVVKFIMK